MRSALHGSAGIVKQWCSFRDALQTYLSRKGRFKPLTSDRYALEAGDIVKFGAVECQVHLEPESVLVAQVRRFAVVVNVSMHVFN